MTPMYPNDSHHAHSLCTLRSGNEVFGIEATAVREALHQCDLRKVPLAPPFVAGVVSYRGEILLAVSLRALLGLDARGDGSSAVVLEDSESGEPFALLLDELLDVVEVDESAWEPNPAMLDDCRKSVYSGVYRTTGTPLARLDPCDVQPTWLMRHQGDVMPAGARA